MSGLEWLLVGAVIYGLAWLRYRDERERHLDDEKRRLGLAHRYEHMRAEMEE